LLASIYERAMAGDMQAAALFFKVCGLIKKPRDDDQIEALARQLLDGMIAEAREQRASEACASGRFADLGSEE
jgi:hypothetical protein